MCQKGIYMANGNTRTQPMSTVPPELDEIQGFSYNALAKLGPNYFTRKWLPKKGVYFYAFVMAMRAHVFWNYETRQQQNKVFFEATTIGEMCGMSRSTVFRLMNDPDMALFIRRKPQRRWDKVQHKEVQTSNLWLVAMDDPPANEEDREIVRREQARVEALQREETEILDDDRPAKRQRSPSRKSSESHRETLIAVSQRDSDSSVTETHEDRILSNYSYDGFTSIREGEALGPEAIRTADRKAPGRRTGDEANQIEPDRKVESRRSMSAKRIESDRELLAALPGAAVLSEGEAWKVDARVAAGGIIASNLEQLGGNAPANAVERVLSAHAAYRTPAEILGQLADIARKRVANRAGHIEEDGEAGYFITTLCNLASEARKAHYDLDRLRKQTGKAERKAQAEQRVAQGLPVTPPQRPQVPRQGAYNRAGAKGRTPPTEDYYDRFKPGLQGR